MKSISYGFFVEEHTRFKETVNNTAFPILSSLIENTEKEMIIFDNELLNKTSTIEPTLFIIKGKVDVDLIRFKHIKQDYNFYKSYELEELLSTTPMTLPLEKLMYKYEDQQKKYLEYDERYDYLFGLPEFSKENGTIFWEYKKAAFNFRLYMSSRLFGEACRLKLETTLKPLSLELDNDFFSVNSIDLINDSISLLKSNSNNLAACIGIIMTISSCIEKSLRIIAIENNFPVNPKKHPGLGSYLSFIKNLNILPDDILEYLDYMFNVETFNLRNSIAHLSGNSQSLITKDIAAIFVHLALYLAKLNKKEEIFE